MGRNCGKRLVAVFCKPCYNAAMSKVTPELSAYFSRIGKKGALKAAKRADLSEIRKRAAATRARNKAALTQGQ